MDNCLFPDLMNFDPKHFDMQIPQYSFVAFRGGARICPGYEFARLETLITMHYLVNRFTWKRCIPDISLRRSNANFKGWTGDWNWAKGTSKSQLNAYSCNFGLFSFNKLKNWSCYLILLHNTVMRFSDLTVWLFIQKILPSCSRSARRGSLQD